MVWFGLARLCDVSFLVAMRLFCCGVRRVCVCVGFVVDFGAGRCSASAVGLVVKYLVAIEMPRVRFPDGALSYAHTSPTAPFLRGRYPASTPRQRVLSSAPSRAGLPATPPLADAVRRHGRVAQLHTTSHKP